MERSTKVFIVDDHPILCEMVAAMLRSDPSFEVVGTASSIRETLAAIGPCGPDLMLIDLALKDGSGIQLVRTLRSRGIKARMLVLTGVRSKASPPKHSRLGSPAMSSRNNRLPSFARRSTPWSAVEPTSPPASQRRFRPISPARDQCTR